jgi:hypothetical protein
VQDSLILSDNVLRRWAGTTPGPVITLAVHNSGAPGQLLINGNQIIQESASHLLSAEGVKDTTISNNAFQYLGPTAGFAAISVRAVSQPADRFLVLGNRVLAPSTAPLSWFLKLYASPFSIGAVSVVGNITDGVGVGLRCDGTGGFTRPIVHAANYYDGASAAVSNCTGTTVVAQYP